jgi:hypothetical protein
MEVSIRCEVSASFAFIYGQPRPFAVLCGLLRFPGPVSALAVAGSLG